MTISALMTELIPATPANTAMGELSLAAISPTMTSLLIGVFLIISIVMILIVLIQRPQGGGLSGAFGAGGGGAGAGQTAFGTKTGDVLTWATIGIFILFLVFAIILNFATRPSDNIVIEPVISVPAGQAADSDVQELIEDTEEVIEDGTTGNTPDTAADDATEPSADLPTDQPTGDD